METEQAQQLQELEDRKWNLLEELQAVEMARTALLSIIRAGKLEKEA